MLNVPKTADWGRRVRNPQERLDWWIDVNHDAPQGPIFSPHHPSAVLVHQEGGAGARVLHQDHYHYHPHGTEERGNGTQLSRKKRP
jgi:hypothetical protein